MNPFINTQIQAIIEGIRVLETIVTAPLGLYSDIKMLREALRFPEAAELSRDEIRERRVLYSEMTDAYLDLALDTVASIEGSLAILDRLNGGPEAVGLSIPWTQQAGRILDRARQKAGGDLRAKTASRIRGLCVIVDPIATGGRSVSQVSEAVLRGGAGVLLLGGKTRDKGKLLSLAREIKSMCDGHDALFMMDADADIAVTSDAHGLHTGQTGLPVADARGLLAPKQLLGTDNPATEEALESQAQGVDYVTVGPIFETGGPAVGVEGVRGIKELVAQPILATGGIDVNNVAGVVEAGADCAGVGSVVTQAQNPEVATRGLAEAIESAR